MPNLTIVIINYMYRPIVRIVLYETLSMFNGLWAQDLVLVVK